MPEHTFDPGLVFDDVTNLPAESALGDLLASADDPTPLPIYDMQGNPLARLTTNDDGYCARFRADVGVGVIMFGVVAQPVVSMESRQAAADLSVNVEEVLAAQAASAASAAAAAESAATAVAAAATAGTASSLIGTDTDGTPYFEAGGIQDGTILGVDTDGVPFFTPAP